MKTNHTLPVICALAVIAGPALAQSPEPLSESELASTIIGKKVEHMRLSDKRIFIWDVRKSGVLYLKNTSLKGKWAFNERGEFCVQWDAARIPDQCYFFL